MSRILKISVWGLLSMLWASGIAAAQAQAQPLRVGIKETPPFAMKADDGKWTGLSVELWNEIAEDLRSEWIYEESDLPGLVAGLSDSTFDVVVGALTITAEREAKFDFSHPFYSTGIGIATHADASRGWLGVLEQLFSWDFIRVVGALLVLLWLVGVLVWYLERRRNPEEFAGMGSGFWWSAVTMTTVGYGDKAPRSFWGRAVAVIWMFAALMLVASFTANITSILTLSQLESQIRSTDDLRRVRIATVASSTSSAYLTRENVSYEESPDAEACLRAVADRSVDVAVYDRPILRYLVKHRFARQLIVPALRLERQDYGLALPEASPLRENINRALLEIIQRPDWEDRLEFYLGQE
jgi:ABC-type amino acid transport substrate-binding protein